MRWQVTGGKWRLASGERHAEAGLPRRLGLFLVAVAIGLAAGPSTRAFAQETPRPKDDALDSLLEKLSDPSDRTEKRDDKASKKEGQDGTKSAAPKAKGSPEAARPSGPGTSGAKGDKPQEKKPGAPSDLSSKDQEVDDLLQKLGETTETPAPEERRRGGGGEGEKPEAPGPAGKPGKTDRDRLSGKDKETDEHLEELAGRRRRKRGDDEQRSGPAGELIKEMREIEKKLARPDTGEGTREEQKKVVKRIDTLIEEARRSGQSSIMRVVRRRSRQQGQEKGRQQGQTEGAMAQGAPATKPAKPPSTHSKAGGKDIWGHLPPEMRAEIENMINEQPLSTRQELVDRYYLSVGKGKPIREDSP